MLAGLGLCPHCTSPASRLVGDPRTIEWAQPRASGRRKDIWSRLELVVFSVYNLSSPKSLLNPAEQDLGLPWAFWVSGDVSSLIPGSRGGLRAGWCHGRRRPAPSERTGVDLQREQSSCPPCPCFQTWPPRRGVGGNVALQGRAVPSSHQTGQRPSILPSSQNPSQQVCRSQ